MNAWIRSLPGLQSAILDPQDLPVRPSIVSGASIQIMLFAKRVVIGQAEYSTPLVQKKRPVRLWTKSAIAFGKTNALGCMLNLGRNEKSGRINSSTETTRLDPEKAGQSTLFLSGPG